MMEKFGSVEEKRNECTRLIHEIDQSTEDRDMELRSNLVNYLSHIDKPKKEFSDEQKKLIINICENYLNTRVAEENKRYAYKSFKTPTASSIFAKTIFTRPCIDVQVAREAIYEKQRVGE
jgi:hypothetical protein